MSLLEEIERACEQARDPKIMAQTKKLQEGRKRLRKKFKEDYAKMVEEVLNDEEEQ